MSTAAAASSRPGPRPWLAALLSLVVPGLGHLYAWRVLAALLCWLAALVASVAGLVLVSRATGLLSLVVPVVLGVAIRVAIAAHAWRLAQLASAADARRPGGLALVAVLCAAVAVAALTNTMEREAFGQSLLRAFRVPSGAMSPAILPGDWLFVRSRRPVPTPPRGEIVAYRWEGSSRLERVAGVAGDTLSMRGGQLVRNGVPVAEPYVRREPADTTAVPEFRWQRRQLIAGVDTSSYRPTVGTWGPLVVPPGQLFVLGDNRNNSLDSRYVGFIAADSAFGVPALVYFSRDPETGAVRWGRIGHVIR